MKKLISTKEVAAVIGVSVMTIEIWKKHNYIPYIRLGRRTLFDPDELTAWIDSNRIPQSISKLPKHTKGAKEA